MTEEFRFIYLQILASLIKNAIILLSSKQPWLHPFPPSKWKCAVLHTGKQPITENNFICIASFHESCFLYTKYNQYWIFILTWHALDYQHHHQHALRCRIHCHVFFHPLLNSLSYSCESQSRISLNCVRSSQHKWENMQRIILRGLNPLWH